MNLMSAETLSPGELAALLHFYAEAGVDWMLEDAPIDRFAEFAALAQQKSQGRAVAQPAPEAPERRPQQQAQRVEPARKAALPDDEAIAEARRVSAEAKDVAGLVEAVAQFAGCNLKNSARTTAFAGGNLAAPILVIGGAPGPDEDREGAPFAGSAAQMLDKMLAAIGLGGEQVLLANVIPWRPPGNRQPTARELEICLPFSQRLIDLARPDRILVLGNYPARVFADSNDSIHGLRGKWLTLRGAGQPIPFLATFHPLELMATPACKRLAWQDLLAFRAGPVGSG